MIAFISSVPLQYLMTHLFNDWVDYLELDTFTYITIKSLDKQDINKATKVIVIDDEAFNIVKKIAIDKPVFQLPELTTKNILLTDKSYIKTRLELCKEWIQN